MAPAARRIPWARPKHELLLLALVAVVALLPVDPANPQDASRLCLANALVHGRLSADDCLSDTFDRASYDGHLFSDKAPGLALLEIPAATVFAIANTRPQSWGADDERLWAVRLFSVGLCFLLSVFLVGRISEGLAPGSGALGLVAFGLGTLAGPLAPTGFAHDASAAALFAAFVLAWSRRPFAAGLIAGIAVLIDYSGALAVAVIAAYALAQGWRSLARLLAGGLPAVAALAAYDWAAFGKPWHLSYAYVDNMYALDQHAGLFGIEAPKLVSTVEVLAGPGGLLVVSPILLLAALGLRTLATEHPREAAACAAITALYILLDCSYFLPYGGVSPGPRFLIPALPFLALGLGPAARRYPRSTIAATTASVITVTAIALVWPSNAILRQTVWGEIARIPLQLGSSRYVQSLSPSALGSIGVGPGGGAAIVAAAALTALVLSIRTLPRRDRDRRRTTPPGSRSLRATAGALAVAYLVLAADVSAVFAYPYGNRTEGPASQIAAIDTTITAAPATSYTGGYVNFVVTVDYQGDTIADQLLLTVHLSPGMRIAGLPHYTIGSGCTYGSTFVCHLGYLPAGHSTQVDFGAQVLTATAQTVSATASTAGVTGYNHPTLTIPVGH